MSKPEPGDRPPPRRIHPDRGIGGFYRSADRKLRGKVLRGVPLQAAEDAVLTVLRTADSVFNANIERGMRVAATLRGAANRGRPDDPEADSAVDAGERIFRRALVAGLAWLEAAAAEPGSPLRRLLAAEYRLAGSMLGLRGDGEAAAGAQGDGSAARPDPPRPQAAHGPAVPAVKHGPKSAQRAVRVLIWELEATLPAASLPLTFYPATPATGQKLTASVALEAGQPVLTVWTRASHAAGAWRAALCNAEGRQIGLIGIEL